MSYTPQNPNGQSTMANSSPVVIASNQSTLPVDGSGVTQPVSGTITANIGTSGSLALNSSVTGLQVAQGSTTSGQSGNLVQGAVTTSAPTYTTAQTSPLSLDTSGNLRVSVTNTPSVTVSGVATASNQTGGSQKTQIVDGSGNVIASTSNALNVSVANSSLAVTQSGTWTVQPGNSANTTPWLTSLNPSTSGGWSVSSQTALTNSAVSVKGSAGQLGGYMFFNPNATIAYIQVFNVAAGSVTLATTPPAYVVALPANGAANVEFANGIAHSTAISVAATTTATGSGVLTSSLTGFVLFK